MGSGAFEILDHTVFEAWDFAFDLIPGVEPAKALPRLDEIARSLTVELKYVL